VAKGLRKALEIKSLIAGSCLSLAKYSQMARIARCWRTKPRILANWGIPAFQSSITAKCINAFAIGAGYHSLEITQACKSFEIYALRFWCGFTPQHEYLFLTNICWEKGNSNCHHRYNKCSFFNWSSVNSTLVCIICMSVATLFANSFAMMSGFWKPINLAD